MPRKWALQKVISFGRRLRWKLLYRASEHGISSENFHRRCDGRGATITLAVAAESRTLIGGFTNIGWGRNDQGDDGLRADPTSFLFRFEKGTSKVETFPIRPRHAAVAVKHERGVGPNFGNDDLLLCMDKMEPLGSYGKKYWAWSRSNIFCMNGNHMSDDGYLFVVEDVEVFALVVDED